MSFEPNYLKEPELKNPIAVVGFPGIAYIGKLGVEFLIKELNAEKFAELYADFFPGWAVRTGGLVKGLKINFYEASLDGFDRDFILLTADAQASFSVGQYELSNHSLNVIEDQNADIVVSMAAFLSSEKTERPVKGAATDPETAVMIAEQVELLKGGRIVGMNGLFPGLAKDRGMSGFCLLGSTFGGNLDPKASKEVLSALSKIFGFELDLSDFKNRIPDLPRFRPPEMMTPPIISRDEEIGYIF